MEEVQIRKATSSWCKQILHKCIDCGKERWVYLLHGVPRSLKCGSCSQKTAWRNKPHINHHYVWVKITEAEMQYLPMANKKGYVAKHRLIMAKHLGRCLANNEIVKYINGDKNDNRLENLKLLVEGTYNNQQRRGIHKCVDCGKERLVAYNYGVPQSVRCRSCAMKLSHKTRDKSYFKRGKDAHTWKGGRHITNGYVQVWLDRESVYYPMADVSGYVLEHRLVMAQYLGRCLHPSEMVHHRNENKSDNRVENLELVSQLENLGYEKMCRNCELKKEIRLLRWQIKELSKQLQEKLNLSFP